MKANTRLLQTSDGSHTLYVPEIDETYHSTHGAMQESMHIFIDSALRKCVLNKVRILEIGFGTGLNALLTKREADLTDLSVQYTTLEKFPVSNELIGALNYSELVGGDVDFDFFNLMHQAPWNNSVLLCDDFEIHKIECDFTQFESAGSQFDVVYFDAFSPDKQPEMWTVEQFGRVYDWCAPNAILTTYCAKGVVRRALQEVGFKVERLPGPPGKREILRATKI
ncbi:MAG: tRNA (5-methylaminomethyl-2-thiouridine)(34)-methyltransferase MnmD [Paludibacter sp.]|nr:tRNA (5-methylaminomethyl-2-thiouridine)(34)-methyltransferase MnmD [Paludibacter sp.]